MRKVVSGDAGAQLLLAEAQSRLETARAERMTHPGGQLSFLRPRPLGSGRPVLGVARLTRRLLGATSTARGICVE
jgi:hypothetical protein